LENNLLGRENSNVLFSKSKDRKFKLARFYDKPNKSRMTLLNTYIKFVRIDEQGDPVPISERAKEKIKKLCAE